MDCSKCNRSNDPQAVPYIAFETAIARYDRTNRRLFIIVLCLVMALVASWVSFAIFEAQYDYAADIVTEQEITQDTDNGGNNTVIGGVVYGETDG